MRRQLITPRCLQQNGVAERVIRAFKKRVHTVVRERCGGIRSAVAGAHGHLDLAGIDLRPLRGAHAHLSPDRLVSVEEGGAPTLEQSRLCLLEPSHHVMPPQFQETVFELMAAGLVPVLTHPERSWDKSHYELFARLVDPGSWMQITAGA